MPAALTALLISLATLICNIAAAVEETITTPTPGLGHGHLADAAACITYLLGFFGYC